MGKCRNNQGGKKPLTHQMQKQRGHRVQAESLQGVWSSSIRQKRGIALRLKTNTNKCFFPFFSKCGIKKRIIERDSSSLWRHGGIGLLTEEIDAAEILRMCCFGIC